MLRVVTLLLLFVGAVPFAKAQATQEFLVTFMNGRSYSYILDADWQPTVSHGQLVLKPATRVQMFDVALIQPYVPQDVRGLKRIKLLPQTPRVNNPGIEVWVAFDPLTPGAPKDNVTGLVQAAPQTWVRPEAFRIALE
jgi:hypothetical protein